MVDQPLTDDLLDRFTEEVRRLGLADQVLVDSLLRRVRATEPGEVAHPGLAILRAVAEHADDVPPEVRARRRAALAAADRLDEVVAMLEESRGQPGTVGASTARELLVRVVRPGPRGARS